MKRKLRILHVARLLTLVLLAGSASLSGQTDPGTANLKHQWSFDDGTAKDAVTAGAVNGALAGGASIQNKALKLSASGQYLTFSGSGLALNAYPSISQEIWYTSVSGANTGYTMLSYFGNTSGGQGYNYISTSTARGDNVSRTCITNGTYDKEVGVNGAEYDDGKLHQMVSVVRADSVILYIDGRLIGKTANAIPLSTIGSGLAYLGKGGYTSDPTWLGSISKFSIYNKSLSASEVKFLYQQGAESTPILAASASVLSFDDLYKTETFTVTALNLSNPITITAPAGINVSPTTLAANANNATVSVTYDGTSVVDGNITLSSGSDVLNIPVKSYTNSCYTKLYPTFTNLVSDPYVSKLSNFAGWGTRVINTNPNYVYCGATSGNVSGTNAGSLDVSLTGKLVANTKYRVKAKVYAIGGSFQVGVSGIGTADVVRLIGVTNAWQDVDFTFTTGSTLTTPSMYFNNYGLAGTNGFIDNWEMYAVPKVYTSPATLNFEAPGSKTISVRGVNLSDDISISASEGFAVSPGTMPAATNGGSLNITFNGPNSKSGYVYFSSGNVKDSLLVTGSVQPTLVVSPTALLLDELSNTATFTVKGYNLTSDIVFSAPEGITFSPATLPSTSNGTLVTATFDGKANSSGQITLTSGSVTKSLNIIARRNDECFTALYPGAVNLITDPTCNNFVSDGSGNRSINSDPKFVYCGARSAKVTGSGSLERNLTGVMKPNTTYRIKAKVYKYGACPGQNIGDMTYTLDMDSVALPGPYRLIKEAMDSACIYFSKYTPFSYNVYVYYNSGIPTAQVNYYHGSLGFGANTRYMWVGTAMHEMCHWLGSGTTNEWHSKIVDGIWTGAATAALVGAGVIHGDSMHFWPYGINQKEEVTGLGSVAAQENALAMTAKVTKAMLIDDCGLPTNNTPVGVGVRGWDATQGQIYNEVTTRNSWQDIDFTFTTGSKLGTTQVVFFNGGTGYIDNWEMYEITESGVNNLPSANWSIYGKGHKIVCDFTLSVAGSVEFQVYNMQGILVAKQTGSYGQEKNQVVINNPNLANGVYLVKMASRGISSTSKIIIL